MILELKDNIKRRKPIEYELNENNCFLITSHYRDKFGHVIMKTGGNTKRLHRYIYELHHRTTLGSDKVVRHKCDNPSCVNIEHLEIGSHSDNVADRVGRNRSATGVKNGRAKLNEDDVRLIRLNTDTSITDLSKAFSVDRKVIYDIKNRVTWRAVI